MWSEAERREFAWRLEGMETEPEMVVRWWVGHAVVSVVMVVLAIAGLMAVGKRYEGRGYERGMEAMKREAAQLGHAEYYLGERGELEWRWR